MNKRNKLLRKEQLATESEDWKCVALMTYQLLLIKVVNFL